MKHSEPISGGLEHLIRDSLVSYTGGGKRLMLKQPPASAWHQSSTAAPSSALGPGCPAHAVSSGERLPDGL